jgi:hypothetical protein
MTLRRRQFAVVPHSKVIERRTMDGYPRASYGAEIALVDRCGRSLGATTYLQTTVLREKMNQGQAEPLIVMAEPV